MSRLLLLALMLPGLAQAQDDAPPSDEGDTQDPPQDEGSGPAMGEASGEAVTGPGFGQPSGDTVTGPGFGEPAGDVVEGPGFGDEPGVDAGGEASTEPVRQVVDTTPTPIEGGNVPTGVRIQPFGASSGVDMGQAFVVGANRGTNQTLLRARYARGRYGVQVGLPFVAYSLPRQPRDTGLGNLQVDGWMQLGSGDKGYTALSIEGHANLGSRTYSWVHDADDIWPGYGVDVAMQVRRGTGALTTMGRAALGVRGGKDYAPWADTYVTFEVAAGLDYAVSERVGIVGEMSVAYWDLSPWDVTGLARVDLIPGLRARGGLIFPLGVWTGISRVDESFRGFTETTLVVDLSMSL